MLSLLKLTVQPATTKGAVVCRIGSMGASSQDAIDWRMGWLALYHIIILIWSFSQHVAGGTPVPAALLLCEPYGEQQEQQKQINTNQWTRGHASAPLLWPTTKKKWRSRKPCLSTTPLANKVLNEHDQWSGSHDLAVSSRQQQALNEHHQSTVGHA